MGARNCASRVILLLGLSLVVVVGLVLKVGLTDKHILFEH